MTPRQLPEAVAIRLRHGDITSDYRAPAHLTRSLAGSFVRAGYTFEHLSAALVDPANVGGAHHRAQTGDDAAKAKADLWAMWTDARGHVNCPQDDDELPAAVTKWVTHVRTQEQWPGRRGPTQFAVAEAFCREAMARKSTTLGMGVRQVSAGAGITSLLAVRRGIAELKSRGLLRELSHGRAVTVPGRPAPKPVTSTYELTLPRRKGGAKSTHSGISPCVYISPPHPGPSTQTPPLPSASADKRGRPSAPVNDNDGATTLDLGVDHDVFRHGALGKTGFAVYVEYLRDPSATKAQVAKATGRDPSTVKAKRKALLELGLAEQVDTPSGRQWRPIPPTTELLDAAAREAGTAGRRDRDCMRHEIESAGFAGWLAWRATERASPETDHDKDRTTAPGDRSRKSVSSA